MGRVSIAVLNKLEVRDEESDEISLNRWNFEELCDDIVGVGFRRSRFHCCIGHCCVACVVTDLNRETGSHSGLVVANAKKYFSLKSRGLLNLLTMEKHDVHQSTRIVLLPTKLLFRNRLHKMSDRIRRRRFAIHLCI